MPTAVISFLPRGVPAMGSARRPQPFSCRSRGERTICTFGGDDPRTLFMTSARETLAPEKLRSELLAGSLVACDAGVAGRATHRFGG
jgi:sugar lactone lactonase YvrE